jgi:hypothetical protein
MAGPFAAALILIVKGDMALGYRGFGGTFDNETVESVVVPLTVPSVFKTVHDTKQPFSGPPPADAHAVQGRFFKLFPGPVPADITVFPVTVKGRMVCLLYGHAGADRPLASGAVRRELGQIAQATEQAFWRLIRAAKDKS